MSARVSAPPSDSRRVGVAASEEGAGDEAELELGAAAEEPEAPAAAEPASPSPCFGAAGALPRRRRLADAGSASARADMTGGAR